MERRQLEYLIAVADAGSFTRAADMLHVAQPGLSAQVAGLERELGERLLDRDRHGARATAVGELVLHRARRVLAAFDSVRAAVDEAQGLVRGRVAVGTVRGVPLGELATNLARFRARHGGVEVRLVEAESADLLTGLADGALDVALVGLPDAPPPGIRAATVLAARLALAVTPDDPWAGRRRIGLSELAGRPLVALARGTGNREAFERACATAGVTPQVALHPYSFT